MSLPRANGSGFLTRLAAHSQPNCRSSRVVSRSSRSAFLAATTVLTGRGREPGETHGPGLEDGGPRGFYIVRVGEPPHGNGFDQYLRYTDSDVIAHAPVALEALAARVPSNSPAGLGILGPLPPTRDGREDALDSLDDTQLADLERLSTAFFAYPDDPTELLFEFVANRPETFGQLP
jgi:hypothetical protein